MDNYRVFLFLANKEKNISEKEKAVLKKKERKFFLEYFGKNRRCDE